MVAEEHGVAARIIASSDDLERIAADDRADVPALKGWRRQLFGEQALLIACAIPCGWALGYGAAWMLSSIYQQELFRIPLVVSGQTYLFAAIVVAVTGVLSGWLVRRRLDRFDLVAVLKTRE